MSQKNGRRLIGSETNGRTTADKSMLCCYYTRSRAAAQSPGYDNWLVARATSDMLAGALADLAHDLDAASVGNIGERLGTLVRAAHVLRADVWALSLPLTTDGRAV